MEGIQTIVKIGGKLFVFYHILKKIVSVFFNTLNLLMAGNLPPFCCTSVVVEKDRHFLVVELGSGETVFPGGFMRWREQPEQTAQRECREETGLQIHLNGLIGYYPTSSYQLDRMSTLNLAYAAEVTGGTLRDSIEGHPYWISEGELREKLSPRYHIILDDYLRYRDRRDTSINQA